MQAVTANQTHKEGRMEEGNGQNEYRYYYLNHVLNSTFEISALCIILY